MRKEVKKALEVMVMKDPAQGCRTLDYLRNKLPKIAEFSAWSDSVAAEVDDYLGELYEKTVAPFQETVNKFFGAKADNLSDSELWQFQQACFATGNMETAKNLSTALKQRKEDRKVGLERYSAFVLSSTVKDYGPDVEKQFSLLMSECRLLRRYGYKALPNKTEVERKLRELRSSIKNENSRAVNARFFAAADAGILTTCDEQAEKCFRKIVSQKEAEKVLQRIIKRENEGIILKSLHFTDDGKCIPSVFTQDWGYLAEKMTPYLEDCKIEVSPNIVRKVKRFCRSVLRISLQSVTAGSSLFTTADGKQWNPVAIYTTVDPDGYDRIWMNAQAGAASVMVDICCNAANQRIWMDQLVYSVDTWKTHFAINGYYKFDFSWATSSPGELKNRVLMVPGVYEGPFKERKVNWSQIKNLGSSGAWKRFCETEHKLDLNTIAEFTSRITLVNAYAKYFKLPMRTFGVYTGKVKARVTRGNIPKGHEFMDGMFVYSSEYIAAMIEAALKDAIVDPYAVIGLALQSRPFNVKGLGIVVSDSVIQHMIDAYETRRLDINCENVDDEFVEAWWNLSFNKFKSIDKPATEGGTRCHYNGEEIDLANKLIVFHWDEESYEGKGMPDCLVDANALKTGFEPCKRFKPITKVLAIPHKDKGVNVTSGQMLYAPLASDEERTIKMLQVVWDIILQKEKEKLFDEQGHVLSWGDMQGRYKTEVDDDGKEVTTWISPRYSEIVDKIAPVLSLRFSFTAWTKRVDRIVKKLSKMLNRLNFPIIGTHVTIIPDLGMTVGGGIPVLGCRKDGVTELFSNNPLATTLSKEEYIEKYKRLADAAGIPEDIQQDFVDMVNALSPGLVAVPADEITARANEGWDFDGDSMYIFMMHRGYVEFIGMDGETHYRWAEDGEETTDYVTFGHANRYPKTHPYGFMKVMSECWYDQPVCVCIK